MPKYYFTFGQVHRHVIDGQVFDKDCIVMITADFMPQARAKMFKHFLNKWSMQYDALPDLKYFPRGVVQLPDEPRGHDPRDVAILGGDPSL